MDHKTAKSAQASYFYDYHLDPQAVFYPYAARELGIEVVQFGVNVIAKTQSPYITRKWFPIDWKYIDWAADNLKKVVDRWASFPEDPGDIVDTIPGNPCHCRNCSFTEICHYDRSKLDFFVSSVYEIADHSEFRNTTEEGGA